MRATGGRQQQGKKAGKKGQQQQKGAAAGNDSEQEDGLDDELGGRAGFGMLGSSDEDGADGDLDRDLGSGSDDEMAAADDDDDDDDGAWLSSDGDGEEGSAGAAAAGKQRRVRFAGEQMADDDDGDADARQGLQAWQAGGAFDSDDDDGLEQQPLSTHEKRLMRMQVGAAGCELAANWLVEHDTRAIACLVSTLQAHTAVLHFDIAPWCSCRSALLGWRRRSRFTAFLLALLARLAVCYTGAPLRAAVVRSDTTLSLSSQQVRIADLGKAALGDKPFLLSLPRLNL
jgi:hypothetical protein